MSDRLPSGPSRFAPLRVVPTGRECWWTLGPNIRNPYSTAAGLGIADVVDLGGGRCLLVMKDGFRVAASSLEWQCRLWHPVRSKPDIAVQAVDLLCEWPPHLPQPTGWQQITRRGEVAHPGHTDMKNWRYDNPW